MPTSRYPAAAAITLIVAVAATGGCRFDPRDFATDFSPVAVRDSATAPETVLSPQSAEPSELTGPGCGRFTDGATLDGLLPSELKGAGASMNQGDGPQFTLFVPDESALTKLDPGTVDRLRTDASAALKLLAYHMLPVAIPPKMLDGHYRTVEGGEVTVSRSDTGIDINDATVVCGGFHASNATVYMIDRVLVPPMRPTA
ncbi:fasciclin domain-containing protein [Nocardia jejuensis]|uniref:fasciclin domain-containing protein n=1 Tax=Nocardia jejuensis TaxID=328049 RepID=UPI0008354CD9|nr:fasciclin domain-containing protein [Nocardia jejuensis]